MTIKKRQPASSRSRAPRHKARVGALPRPLLPSEVFAACPIGLIRSPIVKGARKSHEIISQSRAVQAINMGLGIRKPGYNIFVAGMYGTGRTSVIRTFLEKVASQSPTPEDWIYVHDFNSAESPRPISLPAGSGRKLAKEMDNVIKTLRDIIPEALQSEDYENAVNTYLSISNDRKAKLFSHLEKIARKMDFQIKSTRLGIETIPIVDGRSITEKEYNKLTDEQRDGIERNRSELEPKVLEFARKVRSIEHETREHVENLRAQLGEQLVGNLLDPIKDSFKEHPTVVEYLSDVKKDILENLMDFVEIEDDGGEDDRIIVQRDERDKFVKYRVNVFVDNRSTKGAPIVIATNPNYYNLYGRVEKNVEHGTYMTDLTMIQPGAIHRANGGYLVLEANDVFSTPNTWETLKRVLKTRLGFIEDMGEQFAMLPTSGLRPKPIPLDIKVVLIGSDEIYHMLHGADEEFQKIFKIKAEFDYKMERSNEHIKAYSSFVGTRVAIEGLLPFDRTAVAAVVEHGSRLADDQRFLSTQFGQIKDLTIEADYIARQKSQKIIRREHVEEALDHKVYRLNMYEEHLLEMVKSEDLLIAVDGERIGQVNGIAVYDLGDVSFGKLGRISCITSISDDGIFNVERASKLSGNIHDKGMYILSGFLKAALARDHALGFSASVCFEQSYGIIDGDSATVAELVAILSSFAEIPVRQNFAMTGSTNQFGDIQPVGGINEKIEGFFKVCRLMGKGKSYNVLIPRQNVVNLMLHRDVREAVSRGFLNIIPISHVREAFELATGVGLGLTSVHDASFSPGSALARIQDKLARKRAERRREDREGAGPGHIMVSEKRPAAASRSSSGKKKREKSKSSGRGRG